MGPYAGLDRTMNSQPGWVIVGLGNPGPRFDRTRHNVGFRCIDLIAREYDIPLSEKRHTALLGTGSIGHERVVIAKPRTFVNDSGAAAHYLRQRFGISVERLLVVYDDMDLPLGSLRIRASGGSGGHNGLNSISATLGGQAYPRIRIGIGRPVRESIDHVLGRFEPAEEAAVERAIGWAVDAIKLTVISGIEASMNYYN